MRARSRAIRLACCAAAVLVAQLAVAATKTVQVGPNGALVFSPAAVTVDVGDTVEWQWGTGFHSTTRQGGAETWDSGAVPSPHTFSHTFTHPGTYPYVCTVHLYLGMTGTVTVRPTAVTTTTTTLARGSTTSTTTPAAASGTCATISACEAALTAALPAASTATNGKERRVARRLQNLARRATHQLDRATAASSTRRAHLMDKAIRTLERLRSVAENAASQGTLVGPLDPIDADVASLESLARSG